MTKTFRVQDEAGNWRQLSIDEAIDEAIVKMSFGQYQSSLILMERAVRTAPFDARVRNLLGESQIRSGRVDEALLNLRKAVTSDPKNPKFHASLAGAAYRTSTTESQAHYLAAAWLGSTDMHVFSNAAAILNDLGRQEEALALCDKGLALFPGQHHILGNRAVALRRLGRHEEALEVLRLLSVQEPSDARTWHNFGMSLADLGRLTESERALRQACTLDPTHAEAHVGLAHTLLLSGQYGEGFREYEWRWQGSQRAQNRNFAQAQWDGSPLDGRRILLHAEQGYGDSIQFARYLELVAQQGGRISLEVPASLTRLMTWVPGAHNVLAKGGDLPEFDFHCPLLSLPRLLQTELDTIPPPCTIQIPEGMKQEWMPRLRGEKRKIGLVWAGNANFKTNRDRSLKLRFLLPLLDVTDHEFFSLQVGPPAAQLSEEGAAERIRDLSPLLYDFADTAAAISQLDLVICADTGVGHLAASLGTPTWFLLPFAPDWRWMLERTDSPWYPSARLFRQRAWGGWDQVVDEMLVILKQ